ncbi:MAG: hypothetical protein A3K10_14590, partial [Bacteroidetes bacterium RIFCSPLOWO2_12_FULL_31_6]
GKYYDDFIVRKGDVLIGMDGDFKAAIWKGEDALLNQRVCRIVPNNKAFDAKFLFLCLQPYLNAINEETSSVTVKHLSSRTIEEIPLPFPPLPEQQAIVAKIEELLSELENGKQQLQTARQQLKVYRQSLLKWAFEGKLTNKIVKEGELPKGWKVSSIGEIFEVFIGSTPKRNISEYWGGNVNWLSSGEIAFCNITKTREKITEEGLKNSACKVHPKRTVIIAMIGEGKTRGQAAILKIPSAHNQNTAAIRVDEKVYSSMLLYYYLVLKYEENRRVGSGNNQKALNKERVKSIQIPLPPLSEQQQIVSELESKLTVCDKIEETISQSLLQAETLRQSILKKAFEGKLV